MKKICIVTVYLSKSRNCGSYLQAKSLQDFLKDKYGADVYFLDDGYKYTKKSILKEFLYSLKHFKLGEFKVYFSERKMYTKLYKKMKSISLEELNEHRDDYIVIYGSDEIWNASSSKYYSTKLLFGIGIKKGPAISYAVSINNATKNDFKQLPFANEFENVIHNLNAVSVRDDYSKEILQYSYGIDAKVVYDPTFLNNSYLDIRPNIVKKPYLFIYVFRKLDDDLVIKIKQFAKENHLLICGANIFQAPIEKMFNKNPQTFLNLMKNADYVITDTFHGTVFSILYNKKFVCCETTQNKARQLLKHFKLEHLLLNEKHFLNTANNTINWDEINKKIQSENSLNYLDCLIDL